MARRRRSPRFAAALALAATVVGGGAARADVGPDSEWYLLPGVNVGATVERATADLLLGAELSCARLFRYGAWYGAYVDGVRDLRRDATRLSAGIEAGYRVIGVDLGPVLELDGDAGGGLRARAIFTMGWVSGFGGPVIRFGEADQRLTGEIGILLKVPLPLQGGHLSPVR